MDKLTVTQAAEILGVTRQAISNRIRRKTIEAAKQNGTWYIPKSEIERLSGQTWQEETSVCMTCEVLEARLQEKEKLIETLETQMKLQTQREQWLEQQVERTTILLATEQQRLPSPANFFKRLFQRK